MDLSLFPFVNRERFNPGTCAWAYGVNVFDLQAWRQDGCTELFHQYMEMVSCSVLCLQLTRSSIVVHWDWYWLHQLIVMLGVQCPCALWS